MLFQLVWKPGLKNMSSNFRWVWDYKGRCKIKKEAIENAGYLIYEWQMIKARTWDNGRKVKEEGTGVLIATCRLYFVKTEQMLSEKLCYKKGNLPHLFLSKNLLCLRRFRAKTKKDFFQSSISNWHLLMQTMKVC